MVKRQETRNRAGTTNLVAELPIALVEQFKTCAKDLGGSIYKEVEWAVRHWLSLSDEQRSTARTAASKQSKREAAK